MNIAFRHKILVQAVRSRVKIMLVALYINYQEGKWYDNPEPNLVWQGTNSHGNTGKMILLDSKFDKTNNICTSIRRYEITSKNGDQILRDIPTQTLGHSRQTGSALQ